MSLKGRPSVIADVEAKKLRASTREAPDVLVSLHAKTIDKIVHALIAAKQYVDDDGTNATVTAALRREAHELIEEAFKMPVT